MGILAVALAIANLFQSMSVVLWLFSPTSFLKFNRFVKQTYCGFFAHCSAFCENKLIITGDQLLRENGIIAANHQSFFDIPVIWMLGLTTHTVGWMKWFVKDEFKWVPGFGWGVVFIQSILVKRDWSKDEGAIKRTFATLRESKLPFWVVLFPEGTRMKRVKFLQSQEYARKRGAAPYKRTLIPRPKGIWATLQGLEGQVSAIYDISIAFPSEPPSIFSFFCTSGSLIKVHVKRTAVQDLPKIERDFGQWLRLTYAEKDQWMIKNSGWPVEEWAGQNTTAQDTTA